MRIETRAYVEIKGDKVEVAVEIPEEVDIDELDVLSEELHFDVDRLPAWLVVTFKRKKENM
jgi:sRNA-binding carbon storage regulator CsrA